MEELHAQAVAGLLTSVRLLPPLRAYYAIHLDWLLQAALKGPRHTRDQLAHIVGFLTPHLDSAAAAAKGRLALEGLKADSDPLGQFSHLNQLAYQIAGYFTVDQPPTELLVETCEACLTRLSSSHVDIILASLHALSVFGRYGKLQFTEANGAELLHTKLRTLLNHADAKVVDSSVQCLGYLSLGEEHAPFAQGDTDALLALAPKNAEDLQFTVGESLCCLAAGREATLESDLFTGKALQPRGESSQTSMEYVLRAILGKYLTNDVTATERTAGCIWLLSLVKYAGQNKTVKDELLTIQGAFSSLLGDINDITQEVASRGLVLAYELGSSSAKDLLVNNLMQTLASGTTGYKVSTTSKLFPEGALGKAPEALGGGGLSTYKELLSVANEMGSPDMIYKFLSLSSHHSLWNSKKGAAYAATTILADNLDQIQEHLPKIVPKLYRSSYDPNPRLAQSMSNILKSLVKGGGVVQKYFDVILPELLLGLQNKTWRVREASCLAIADALQGREYDQVIPFFAPLCTFIFRAADDIKESVRLAALSALRSLGTLMLRFCDPDHTQEKFASDALDLSLKYLLQEGLLSQADEVKRWSIAQIQKIVLASKHLLKPHVGAVTSTILEGMSALENQALNYLSFHTETYAITQEQLETARMAASKLSPLNDTLDICAKQVDPSNAPELVARLIDLIRTGVGLPTRTATARFIATISARYPEPLAPLAPKLIQAFLSVLTSDKSPVIRKTFAEGLAAVAVLGGEKQLDLVVDSLINTYNTAEGEDERLSVAQAFLALTRQGRSSWRNQAAKAIGLTYFACSDPVEKISELFKETWSEFSVSGILAYVSQVLGLIEAGLSSSQWVKKQQGALACRRLSQDLGPNLAPHLPLLTRLLVSALDGRTWKGKEAILQALGAVAVTGQEHIEDAAPIVNVLLRECKKADRDYKRAALTALAEVLDVFQAPDIGAALAVLVPILDGSDPAVKEDEDDKKAKPLILLLTARAFDCLGGLWPRDAAGQIAQLESFWRLVLTGLATSVWNVQQARLKALAKLLAKLERPSELLTAEQVGALLVVLLELLRRSTFTAVLEPALDVLLAVAQRLDGHESLRPHLALLEAPLSVPSEDPGVLKKLENLRSELASQVQARKRAKAE